MAINLVYHKDGRFCPAIFCDNCGKRLDDVSAAVVVFDPYDEQSFESTLCKGECHNTVEAKWKQGSKFVGWLELDVVLADLLVNCGLEGERLAAAQRKSDELSM